MSQEPDPQDPQEFEIRNPRNLGTTTTTTTTSSMIRLNNPRIQSQDVLPEILEGYKEILETYEQENPKNTLHKEIQNYNSFASFMDLKPRDKEKEWPYYAILFPENEDVLASRTMDRIRQNGMEQQSQRNLKYHVIPSSWLDSLNSFRAHVNIRYPPEVAPSREADKQIYTKVKERLQDKVIQSRKEFLDTIGNLGIPVYYAELYNSLYIYNMDNPNRQPMNGGRRMQKKKKKRKTRKTIHTRQSTYRRRH